MIKTLATAIALILTLSIATTAFAQNATSLQIQVVPQIQRGHQQHLTVFAVDDNGNIVNGTGEIISSIENARGVLVGPKTVYTESGEDVRYKVGPNTSPQNISVNSCLTDSEICAEQSYYVFPKGQAQQPTEPAPEFPPAIPVPTEEPEVPVTNDTEDGEIVIPSNETEVTLPENGTDVTVNDTGEAEPLPPVTNETVPTPIVPPIVNETQGNVTIPSPLPPVTNETIPIEGNVTIPPMENVTEPAQNETAPPLINETAPTEPQPEPLPPISNETIPSGNETVPIEGNITIPATNETQNATVEPEPLPPTNGGDGGANGTTPIEETPNGTIPAELEEPQLNATESFANLENATAILDQKLDEVLDNSNETNRGELKAIAGETVGAMGKVSDGFVEATSDQLQIVQNSAVSVSESIDEILIGEAEQEDAAEGEGESEGEAEAEDEDESEQE